MNLEIERKFLVENDHYKSESFKKQYIKQGFLNSDKNRVVRVRIIDTQGFLTIKGLSNQSGTTRFEWEKEISLEDAQKLLLLCEKEIIEKNRYLVKNKQHTIEVDEFLGSNKGLVIAEIELKTEKESFQKPLWLGKEVTGIQQYYNAVLSKHPFKLWEKKAI